MADFDEQPNYEASPKINFDNRNIQQFIIRRGAHVDWEKSYLCTCRNESGVPRTDCPICHGLGFSFLPPVKTQVMLQSMGRGVKNLETGMSFSGTAMGTTTETESTKIGYRDRLAFDDRLIPESLLFFVTPQDVTHGIDLKYDVVNVDNIVWGYNPTNSLPVSDADIDYEKNIFRPTKEMVGSYVSINMTVVLRFYVVDFLREGRYQYENDPRLESSKATFKQLPALLLLRREDMYIPSVVNNATEATSVALDPRVSLVDDPDIGNFFSGGN